MFCFVEQLCIPDCGEVAKKAEAEAVFKELLASCTSRLARTTLGVRPHEEALFDIIRGSIMNLYKRDYIKSVPTKQEMQLYEGILCTERKAVGDRGFGKINHRRLYPAAVRHYDSLFPNNHIELFDFQNEGNMEQLNEEFCALIHDANTNERNVLRFINHRPAYHIIAGVFKYYNFGHHDAYVFPEFALGKYIADYLLIGKSSGGYEFVFVELEHPNGRTTLKSGHEGETFRKGTYQIYDWKAEIEAHFSASFVTITKYSNKSSLPKKFSEYDSSRFYYAVVAGLREDYNEATYRDRRNKVTQQNILTLHYDNLYDKIKDIITPEDFTEDIFRKVAELLYEQKKSGTVNPAQIISLFAEEEEQREVAELFHARIHEVDSAAERDKALKETILRVKDNSISYRSAHLEPTDMQGLQQLVADKRTLQNMEKMHISID